MNKTMKCSCGKKDAVTPKTGERLEEYLQNKKCSNCNKTGNWSVLSDDEARMD